MKRLCSKTTLLLAALLCCVGGFLLPRCSEGPLIDVCIMNGGPQQPVEFTYHNDAWRGYAIRFDVDGMLDRYPNLHPLDRYEELSMNEGAMGWMEYDIAKLTFSQWLTNLAEQSAGPYPMGYGLRTMDLRCNTPNNRATAKNGRAGLPVGSYCFAGETYHLREEIYVTLQEDCWHLATAGTSRCALVKVADAWEDVDWDALHGTVSGLRTSTQTKDVWSAFKAKDLAFGVYVLQVLDDFVVIGVFPHRDELRAPTAAQEAFRKTLLPEPL